MSLLSVIVVVGAATLALPHYAHASSISAPTLPGDLGASPAAASPARPINPAWRAIIVVGLTTDADQAARLQKQADALSRAFQIRGVGPTAIQIVRAAPGGTVTRDTVLAAFRPLTPLSEEMWIVLLGHAAASRTGQPAFQVTGPRLTAADFAAAVGGLPGKKFVVVGTAMSGGFLAPLMALPDVEAVAATHETGEINEPRFAQHWADALAASPDASFAALATDAAGRIDSFYQKSGRAQGEHARLIDRDTKTITDVPLPAKPAASTTPAPEPTDIGRATPRAPGN